MAIPPRVQSTLLLLVVIGVAWAPAFSGEFQFDDLANIVFDPATAGGAALFERLANGFRPLLRLSYALDHYLWGFAPAGFIATNLVLHAMTVLGVAALARRRLAGGELAAFAAAAIFALQPAHAAVIASASGRSTGLATMLMVGALLAHDRGVDRDRDPRFLALIFMTLAVLAKETALAFPALLVVWEATRPAPPAAREMLRRVAPASILAIALLAIALGASMRLREILQFSFALATPLEALATHAAALPLSLSLWFRPWALTIEHPHIFAPSAMVAGSAVLLLVIGMAVALRRRRPLVALALLWPLAALLATHGVIARLDPIVEKALYPAWIGPSLALAAAAMTLRASPTRFVPILAPAALAIALSLCAWRASVWADPAALWREASVQAPWSARAWSNRALAELGAGHAAAAERAVARALQLDPQAEAAHEVARAISLAAPITKETTP